MDFQWVVAIELSKSPTGSYWILAWTQYRSSLHLLCSSPHPKTWLKLVCGTVDVLWVRPTHSHKESIFPFSFPRLSPLFLLWETQKSFGVNNLWSRREIACTPTERMVFCEPMPCNHCCFCAVLHLLSCSHSTCLYSNTSRHRDPEPWGTPNVLATSAHRRPITTASGCVTLKELLLYNQTRGGWKFQTSTKHNCKTVFVSCSGFTIAQSCEISHRDCHACTVPLLLSRSS